MSRLIPSYIEQVLRIELLERAVIASEQDYERMKAAAQEAYRAAAVAGLRVALAEPAIKESLTVAEQKPMLEMNPQKREWVGLTDREFQPMIQKAMAYYGYDQSQPSHLTAGAGFRVFANAIEEILKDKNT